MIEYALIDMGKRIAFVVFSVIFFSAMFWAGFITPVKGIIIKVPQDAPTIQTAVDMAYSGDIIQVAGGIYYERVNVTKSLSIVGEERSSTIIDGSGIGYVVYVTADNVHISGFTIQNGDRGIYLKYSSGSNVSGNIVSNNYWGISASYSSNNIISHNTVLSNQHGIKLFHSDGNTVSENTILNNYRGIYLDYSSNNVVRRNTVLNNYRGIFLSSNSTFNTLSDNMVSSSNDYGIKLSYSGGCNLSGNTVSSNEYGIRLWYSGGNTLRANAMTGNLYNFWVYGSSLLDYIQDIDTSNTVDNKIIYYWVNQQNSQVPTNAGFVAIVNSIAITVKDLTLKKNYHGVLFAYTNNSIIQNVTASNNRYGIKLYESRGNTVINSTATLNSDFGISLYRSNGTTIDGNKVVSNNRYGVFLDLSSENIFSNNNMSGNVYNFAVDGDSVLDYIQDIGTSNTVEGKPIYYWVNQYGKEVPSDAGYVAIVNSTGITVRNLTLTKNEHGVLFAFTNGSIIENVNTSNNQYGIYLRSSNNNVLRNNNMTFNKYNFGVYGASLSHFIHNVNTSNMVDGRPVYYWVNQHNKQIPTNAGYVAVINSTNITAKGLTLTKNYQGILFAYTTDSVIENVGVSENRFGIYIDYSSRNTIIGNNASSNDFRGIYTYSSNSNLIIGNTVSLNNVGLKIHWYSSYNTIRKNIFSSNELGIWLDSSSENTIYHNNFMNNADQAYQDLASSNAWDDGAGKGNYWSDYEGMDDGSDGRVAGDGVGDTLLPHLGLDSYPLMSPIEVHNIAIISVTPSETVVGIGCSVDITVFVKNNGNLEETFNVTIYFDSNTIGTRTMISVGPGASRTLTFNWDTMSVPSGNYTIKAEASLVPGEINTADNTYINGVVRVMDVRFTLLTLHTVNLYVNENFDYGSSLKVMFHSYSGVYQGEVNVWNGTPGLVQLSKNVTHPSGLPVEKATLVLADDGGSVNLTVASFVVHRSHLMSRLGTLDTLWALGYPKPPIFLEIINIDAQWPYAPP